MTEPDDRSEAPPDGAPEGDAGEGRDGPTAARGAVDTPSDEVRVDIEVDGDVDVEVDGNVDVEVDGDVDVDAELVLFREPQTEDWTSGWPEDRDDRTQDMAGVQPPVALPRAPQRRIIAVSGAKGGVGKTILATNLAIYLATIGRRVVLVDADAAGANIHTCLGIERPGDQGAPPPPIDPVALARDGVADAADEHGLVESPVPGLWLVHAGIDEPRRGTSRPATLRRLAEQLRRIEADYFVVDVGSGTRRLLLDFFLAADVSVFVTLPEPTAIQSTYRFVRAAFARHVRTCAPDQETRRRVVERLRALGNAPPPLDLARRLEAAGDPLADLVREAMATFTFRVVLNQTRLRADLDLGESVRVATRRRFGVDIEYLGYVDYDDTVWSCVRSRRPLLVESPGTKASKSIEKIARRVLAIDSGKGRPRVVRNVPPESHHDLLEVDRGATDEEIRRAYKRVKDIYDSDALCCYGLFDSPSMESLRARLDEAYDVLLDPARRRPYELSVFPLEPEIGRAVPSAQASDEPMPPPPAITPDTEFTGPLLRAVRKSQGMDLAEISHRTKVGRNYLKAIESDDYGALPAPVYVRGFVTEIAKLLRLDPAQVCRTYIRRYSRYLEERERSL